MDRPKCKGCGAPTGKIVAAYQTSEGRGPARGVPKAKASRRRWLLRGLQAVAGLGGGKAPGASRGAAGDVTAGPPPAVAP